MKMIKTFYIKKHILPLIKDTDVDENLLINDIAIFTDHVGQQSFLFLNCIFMSLGQPLHIFKNIEKRISV